MGTTFVTLQDGVDCQGFWMRDGILELWLRFLALHIEDPVDSGTFVSKIRDQWLLASRGYFNGWVPHGLPVAAATPEGVSLIRQATTSLIDALSRGAPTMSKDVLNLMGMGEFQGDFETRRLIEVGHAFIDLLDGKITDDARSTSFMPGC